MSPFLILIIGILIVIGLIVAFRVNAFFALITAAIVVSLLAPGDLVNKITRVAQAFGNTTGSIGIVIAMAAVIGACMMASGAADKIVQSFLKLLGEDRGGPVLAFSGFVLSIPVFFDTVFYLLVPLARSTFRQTGRDYVKYVMAIAAGAVATHALVPPTPGPLIIAANLGVDFGTMIMVGAAVAIPAAMVGLFFSNWMNRKMPIEMRPLGEADEVPIVEGQALPGLLASMLPIILPVVLIASNTIYGTVAGDAQTTLGGILGVVGNPNLALVLSAVAAFFVYVKQRGPNREESAKLIEHALMSGGMIILITAAGGAFGAMLKEAQVGPAIQSLFSDSAVSGSMMLLLGFGIASLLKFAQGSSTVAMITASAMLASMLVPDSLGFHPVYLGSAIGAGSLVGSWMNDSGFWIFSKMGVLTEVETLKTWTPLLAIIGITAAIMSWILAMVLPLV